MVLFITGSLLGFLFGALALWSVGYCDCCCDEIYELESDVEDLDLQVRELQQSNDQKNATIHRSNKCLHAIGQALDTFVDDRGCANYHR